MKKCCKTCENLKTCITPVGNIYECDFIEYILQKDTVSCMYCEKHEEIKKIKGYIGIDIIQTNPFILYTTHMFFDRKKVQEDIKSYDDKRKFIIKEIEIER